MRVWAYRNEKMNQMRALIMIRRKMTALTTQITITVIFERRNDVEFGSRSKDVGAFHKTDIRNVCLRLFPVYSYLTSLIDCLIEPSKLLFLLFINTSQRHDTLEQT